MTITIGTHNGVFHADDVFAVAALELYYSAMGKSCHTIRTRDQKELDHCDVVVDVGDVFDAETNRFDHHMKGGACPPRYNGVPYSSFGLVWRKFGALICNSAAVADIVDRNLVQGVDALDNGFALSTPGTTGVEVMSVSEIISDMNPGWHEGSDFLGAFLGAVESAKVILRRSIARAQGLVRAETLVCSAIANAFGPIIVLDTFCPWQDVVVRQSSALFVCFPAETGDWRVQCVPTEVGGFDKRKALPESWAGLRDAELAALTGVDDAIFCHDKRFIAGAQSKAGAIKLAHLAWEA